MALTGFGYSKPAKQQPSGYPKIHMSSKTKDAIAGLRSLNLKNLFLFLSHGASLAYGMGRPLPCQFSKAGVWRRN